MGGGMKQKEKNDELGVGEEWNGRGGTERGGVGVEGTGQQCHNGEQWRTKQLIQVTIKRYLIFRCAPCVPPGLFWKCPSLRPLL